MRFNDDALPPAEDDDEDISSPDQRRTRLWRIVLSPAPRSMKITDLSAEIVATAPNFTASCVVWMEKPNELTGIGLAAELDRDAAETKRPLLREYADCVLALSISAARSHRRYQRRLAGLFDSSWRVGGPKISDPQEIIRAVRISVGAMAIAHWVKASFFSRDFVATAERAGSALVNQVEQATRSITLQALRPKGGLSPAMADLWINDVPPTLKTTEAPAEEPTVLISSGALDTHRDRPYLGSLTKVIGVPVPLIETSNLAAVEQTLLTEWPWASKAIRQITADLAGRTTACLSPILLLGPPGAGKSQLVRRLGELLGVGVWIASAAIETSGAMGGTARRWSSAEPAHPLQAIARFGHANPIFLIDELDKAGTGTLNGRLWDALLPFLDPVSAARFMDPAAMIEVNLSHVSYLATTNSTAAIPQVLLDRFRVFEVPSPSRKHLPAILPTMVKQAAASRGLRPEWIGSFDEAETAVIHARWTNGSLRSLQRLVAGILRSREKLASRH